MLDMVQEKKERKSRECREKSHLQRQAEFSISKWM